MTFLKYFLIVSLVLGGIVFLDMAKDGDFSNDGFTLRTFIILVVAALICAGIWAIGNSIFKRN